MHLLKDLKFIIVLLVVVAALLLATLAGKNRFVGNTKLLIEQLNSTPVFVTKNQLTHTNFFTVHISNSPGKSELTESIQIQFEKLADKSTLQKLKSQGKNILLASETPGQAAKAWVILNQLGIENIFILSESENPETLRHKFAPDTTKPGVSEL